MNEKIKDSESRTNGHQSAGSLANQRKRATISSRPFEGALSWALNSSHRSQGEGNCNYMSHLFTCGLAAWYKCSGLQISRFNSLRVRLSEHTLTAASPNNSAQSTGIVPNYVKVLQNLYWSRSGSPSSSPCDLAGHTYAFALGHP
jgi:hypothetical protein